MRKFYSFLLLLCFHFASAQQGSIDNSFNPIDKGISSGANGEILSSVVQPDGKIIIVGNFTSYNGVTTNRIARVFQDGSFDNTFNVGSGANNRIYAVALKTNGSIVIVGDFTSYNGTSRSRIAQITPTGSLDATFNPGSGANRTIYTLAVQSDGKILIGGNFTRYNGVTYNRVLRLNSTGSVDATFSIGNGANGIVNDLKIQPDGKVMIVGQFTSYRSTTRNRIARINSNGTVDTNFSPSSGANNTINTVALQADGKYIIGGSFTTFNRTSRNRIARINSTGTLDTGFNPGIGANNTVKSLLILSDGKIVIGGNFTTVNGNSRVRVARLNPTGSLDSGFNPTNGSNNSVNSLSLVNSKIVIAGLFTQYNGVNRSYISLADLNGVVDLRFNTNTGANAIINCTAIQTDGKIIIAGNFTSYNDTIRTRIARLNSNGSVDLTFNPASGANGAIYALAIQPDGRIIIAGDFTAYGGVSRNRIARLNVDGSIDNTFLPGTGANNSIYTASIQSDGKILIGGAFTTFNGTTRNRIARLTTSGAFDATFSMGTGFNSTVNSLILQLDGKILVAGAFTSYNGTTRNRVVRINTNGTTDATFSIGTGFNNTVNALALQTDGNILAGGSFTSYNGVARNRFLRVLSSGAVDQTFNVGSGANSTVLSVAIQADNMILVSGDFTTFNGISYNRLARLLINGSIDNTLYVGTGANGSIKSVKIQNDHKIIISGNFSQYNGNVKTRIVRLNSCPISYSTLNVNACNSYTLNSKVYTESGTYTQTLANSFGCDSIITLNLTISKVTANATVNYPICLGDSIKLTANVAEGYTYLWSGPNNFSSSLYNPVILDASDSLNGVYKLLISNSNGCKDSSEVSVIIGKKPSFQLISNSPVCEGSSLNLLAIGEFDYSWKGPQGFISNEQNPKIKNSTINHSGSYFVTAIDDSGCSSTDSLSVVINPNSDLNLDDYLFNQPAGPNHWVLTSLKQTNSKLLLGGQFTAFNGVSQNRLVRLNPDGNVDDEFDICIGANEAIHSIAETSDGKILVAGYFTKYGNVDVNRLARINDDGSLDLTFDIGSGANNRIKKIQVLKNNKILITGSFSTFNGRSQSRIALLNADGTIDSTFLSGVGANSHINDFAIDSTGKIILVGSFTRFNNSIFNRIVRLNSDGSIDNTFNPGLGPNSTVRSVAIQVDGKIIIGGHFTLYNNLTAIRVVRLNSDGSYDESFNTGLGFNDAVYAIASQPDGKVLFGGYFTAYNGVENINRFLRLNNDGTIDSTYNIGTGFNVALSSISLQSDGGALVTGGFTIYNGINKRNFLFLNADGSVKEETLPINTFGSNSTVYSIDIQNDSKILAVGNFTNYNGNSTNRIVRILPTGTFDTSFVTGSGFDNIVRATKVLSNNKIAIGGYFTNYNNTSISRFAVLNSDGTLDNNENIGAGFNSAVLSIQEYSSGKLLIAGAFRAYNGKVANRLVRLNSDLSFDSTFNVGIGPNSSVFSSIILPNNRIAIAGAFISFNGKVANRIAILNDDGSLDESFSVDLGPNATVLNIAEQPDGKIIAVGYFTQFNGVEVSRVVRINPDGSIDSSFNTGIGADNIITSISIQNDGKIILSGFFIYFNGYKVNRVVRLNSDGSVDTGFNQNSAGANKAVWTSCLNINSNELYLGGSFTSFNGRTRGRIARLRLSNEPVAIEISKSSCGCVEFNNQLFYESGRYTQEITDDFGDKSIVNLSLSIFNPDSTIYRINDEIIANADDVNYQWYNVDTERPVEGATGKHFRPEKDGNYYVVISNSNCKKQSESILFNFEHQKIENKFFSVYPNPFTDKLNISLQTDNLVVINIFDLTGRLVYNTSTYINGNRDINLSSLKSGIYVVKVLSANKEFSQKIVKN